MEKYSSIPWTDIKDMSKLAYLIYSYCEKTNVKTFDNLNKYLGDISRLTGMIRLSDGNLRESYENQKKKS